MKTNSFFSSVTLAFLLPLLSLTGFAEVPAKAAACFGCHGVNGNSVMPNTPSLAGQNSRYIYLQLRDFQEGRRDNAMMTPMTAGLSRDDMRELADYFSKHKLTSKTRPGRRIVGAVQQKRLGHISLLFTWSRLEASPCSE